RDVPRRPARVLRRTGMDLRDAPYRCARGRCFSIEAFPRTHVCAMLDTKSQHGRADVSRSKSLTPAPAALVALVGEALDELEAAPPRPAQRWRPSRVVNLGPRDAPWRSS